MFIDNPLNVLMKRHVERAFGWMREGLPVLGLAERLVPPMTTQQVTLHLRALQQRLDIACTEEREWVEDAHRMLEAQDPLQYDAILGSFNERNADRVIELAYSLAVPGGLGAPLQRVA